MGGEGSPFPPKELWGPGGGGSPGRPWHRGGGDAAPSQTRSQKPGLGKGGGCSLIFLKKVSFKTMRIIRIRKMVIRAMKAGVGELGPWKTS